MKRLIIILLLVHACIQIIVGQSYTKNWSEGTAFTLPENRFEVGIFHPLRYGLTSCAEVSIHTLAFFVMPNLSVKLNQYAHDKVVVASRHSVLYPTWLLQLISMEGTGGIISPEFDIPPMIEFYNELLISSEIAKDITLTSKLGISLAAKWGKLDKRTTIDLPLIYHRLLVFYNGISLRFGGDIEGRLLGDFNYLVDFDYFYTPGQYFNESFESKTIVYWRFSESSEFSLGTKIIYGEYPFGTQWHLLFPLLDYRYAWN